MAGNVYGLAHSERSLFARSCRSLKSICWLATELNATLKGRAGSFVNYIRLYVYTGYPFSGSVALSNLA